MPNIRHEFNEIAKRMEEESRVKDLSVTNVIFDAVSVRLHDMRDLVWIFETTVKSNDFVAPETTLTHLFLAAFPQRTFHISDLDVTMISATSCVKGGKYIGQGVKPKRLYEAKYEIRVESSDLKLLPS